MTIPGPTHIVHATSVAIDGRGVLIEGPSGAGKSDLALRLIDRGAALVSDDYTVLELVGDTVMAGSPATIAGLMEVRGIGIVPMPHVAQAPVALIVMLGDAVDRMPDPAFREVDGIAIQTIGVAGLEPSATIKVELALKRATGAAR